MMEARRVRVVEEVTRLRGLGMPSDAAVAAVQRIDDAANRADGLDYGPFLHVARVYALAVGEVPHFHAFVLSTDLHTESCVLCPFTRPAVACRHATTTLLDRVRTCDACGEDVTAFWPYTKAYVARHPRAFASGAA